MSEDAALQKAIVAHADEDTPRLAYADWLDEHGDPDRAEFIRVQCRLADMPPSDPEWIGLAERQDELVARLKHRHSDLSPEEPRRFHFGYDFLGEHEEPFRRGFPYFINCLTEGAAWDRDETSRVAAELTRLLRTTTLRGFALSHAPFDALRELLATPAAAELTGLELMYQSRGPRRDWRREAADYFRLVATSPALRRVRQLYLHGPYQPIPAGELAAATAFDSVRRLTLQSIDAPKAELVELTRAAWFRRLHHFRCSLDHPAVARPVATGLGELPELHTLDLPGFAPGAVPALAAGEFPALARLLYGGPLGAKYANALAKAKFPALVAFEASNGAAKNDGFAALAKAAWFARLRVLDLSECALGDRAVQALAAHPVARNLRVLKLGDNPFGKTGLAALAKPGAFPALTTLSLRSYHSRKGTPRELAAFLAALQLPNLRHLDLMGWPLGSDGAKALAANPAFANLTRLDLDGCGISDPGAKALFGSPHLRNLVELQLGYNSIKSGADALADPAVMPRLGECRISSNRIPANARAKLERAGLYLIT